MTEKTRTILGFLVVILGLASLLAALFAALNKVDKVPDVAALVSAVGAVIGPIVGAFFGLHIGAAGKAKSDEDRDKAMKKVEVLSGAMPPADFLKVKTENANLFSQQA